MRPENTESVGAMALFFLTGGLLVALQCRTVLSVPVPTTHDDATLADTSCNTDNTTTTRPLVIRPRSDWRALEPREVQPLKFSPAPFVVIHHTYIPPFCPTAEACEESVREIQRMHQIERGWFDIGYTFVIGGDGAIYEGRGWNREGAHAPRYNDKSIGISFVGDYRYSLPTAEMLQAGQELIATGVREGHIRADYALLGHRQTRVTECPGEALFNEISTWPRFRSQPPTDPQDFEAYLAENSLNSTQ